MFRSAASEFVYVRTYSRWLDAQNRREIWPETVQRYVDFITKHYGNKIPPKVLRKIKEKVLAFEVMPSMRFLWAAGEPAEQDNTTIYNCSFAAVKYVDAFAEALYILMCGCGYGFSNQKVYPEMLPVVAKDIIPSNNIFVIEDSKAGWADSVKALVNSLYIGQDIGMDYSKIRPAGARLKTMGGRASGPAPLAQLHSFIREVFYQARGRKLNTLECHDILNEVAQIVVVGGVRRSSEISLSDLDDDLMRDAKNGNFPVRRYMANNSAVYEKKPDIVTFMKEWTALVASGSGERGIFNLEASRKMAPKRRNSSLIIGTNPCAEIQLRHKQFCNLSEAIARVEDDIDTMLEKLETATWMGIIQSCFTKFPYLSKEWKENCDEERLLGVSITGQMDAPHLFTEEALKAYKAKVLRTAKKAAEIMGIPMPAATTCVKPSGTVSQLVDCASGLHRRLFEYGIRTYRISASDSLFKMVRDQGLPVSPENGQRKQDYVKALKEYEALTGNGVEEATAIQAARSMCPFFDNQGWTADKVSTWVVSFPMAAPKGALLVDDTTAIEQLEYYKKIQKNWCEHNASITVYVKPQEWLAVGDWVYKNWDIVNGISFLPQDEHVYEQAPNQRLTKAQYEEMVSKFPKIDYSQLARYETEDNTEGAKTAACAGGICET
jgi:ribonucleoside-triphosphate reductase